MANPYIGSVQLSGATEPYPWPQAIQHDRETEVFTESSATVSGIRVTVPLGCDISFRDYEMAVAKLTNAQKTALDSLKNQWPKVPFNFSPDGVSVFSCLFKSDGWLPTPWESDGLFFAAGNLSSVRWHAKIKLRVLSQVS